MTGVLVLPGTAPEAEWLDRRRQGVTASEIPVLMGLVSGEWGSPYKLYWQKTGDLPADDESDRLRLGHHMEPYIAERFGEWHPEFTISGDGRSLFAHPDRPWQMATPDRVVLEGGEICTDCGQPRCPWHDLPLAVLECKSWGTYDGWGPDGSDEVPVSVRAQALWQADVMGVATAFVACVFLPSGQLRVYEITYDYRAEQDLALMRTEAVSFLGRIERNDPPDVDWRPATADALKRLHPSVEDKEAVVGARTAISYRAAVRRYKDAERRKDEMTNRLRAEMGSAIRAVTWRGDKVASRQVYPVREHIRKASLVDKIVPAKAPKENTTP